MFVTNVLTIWSEALKQIFSEDHPDPKLRDLPVTVEYPREAVDYPGVLVDFVMQGVVRNAGIGHVEERESDTGVKEVLRWIFGGTVEITVGTMGNLERALVVDEITKAVAIGRKGENIEGNLRSMVEVNDLISMNVTWESFTLGGFAEQQGTPWGTDDLIYEATLSLDVEGEVVLEPETGDLVPLSAVVFHALEPGEPVPPPAGTWV